MNADPLRPPETDEEPWVVSTDHLPWEWPGKPTVAELAYMAATGRRPVDRAARDRSRRIAAICFLGLCVIAGVVWVTR